jgi:hypothetical protein
VGSVVACAETSGTKTKQCTFEATMGRILQSSASASLPQLDDDRVLTNDLGAAESGGLSSAAPVAMTCSGRSLQGVAVFCETCADSADFDAAITEYQTKPPNVTLVAGLVPVLLYRKLSAPLFCR